MPKPRSILLCHFAGQPTLRGSERIAQVLALQLTQRGYQVVLWTNSPALLQSVKDSACIGVSGAFDAWKATPRPRDEALKLHVATRLILFTPIQAWPSRCVPRLPRN